MWYVIGLIVVGTVGLIAYLWWLLDRMDEAVKNEADRFNRSARTYPEKD